MIVQPKSRQFRSSIALAALIGFKNLDQGKTLHRFLKRGQNPNFWNEFVFKAYHHHRSDAIFLAGIPDLKATLPHA